MSFDAVFCDKSRSESRNGAMAPGQDLKVQCDVTLVDRVDTVYRSLYSLYREGEIFGQPVLAAADQQRQSMAHRKFIENSRSRPKCRSLSVSEWRRQVEPNLVI